MEVIPPILKHERRADDTSKKVSSPSTTTADPKRTTTKGRSTSTTPLPTSSNKETTSLPKSTSTTSGSQKSTITNNKNTSSSSSLLSSAVPSSTGNPSSSDSNDSSESSESSPSSPGAVTGIFILVVIAMIIAFALYKKFKNNKRRKAREGAVRLIDEPDSSEMRSIPPSSIVVVDSGNQTSNTNELQVNLNDELQVSLNDTRIASNPPMVQLNRSSGFMLNYEPRSSALSTLNRNGNSNHGNANVNVPRDNIVPTNLNKSNITEKSSETEITTTSDADDATDEGRPSSTLEHDLEMEENHNGISPMNRITLSDYNDYKNVEPYPSFESQIPQLPKRTSLDQSITEDKDVGDKKK